jgi:hypothetical protein
MVPGFATVLSLIGLGIFQQIKKLANQMEKLSINMAVIAERVNHHEKRIHRLETIRD